MKLIPLILILLCGCAGSRTTIKDGEIVFDHWCMFRDFEIDAGEIYVVAEPDSVTYWLIVGDYKSRVSPENAKTLKELPKGVLLP